MEKITRNYLQIKSIDQLKVKNKPIGNFYIKEDKKKDFQLNKFFYKQIGKNHHWIDRLSWSENHWIEYISNPNLYTYILKKDDEMLGFFELLHHKDKSESEIEIAYLGLLEKYIGNKLGGYILSEAIKKSFKHKSVARVWVHTCSLDHKNALKNYLSRGMKIFNSEEFNLKSA